MGRQRFNAKSLCEELINGQISEFQYKDQASLGFQNSLSKVRSLSSALRPHKKRCGKVDNSSSPLRRSARFTRKPPSPQEELSCLEDSDSEDGDEKENKSGPLVRDRSGCKELKNAPTSDNQVGIDLPRADKRRCRKVDYSCSPQRRSARLTGNLVSPKGELSSLDDNDCEDGKEKKYKSGHLDDSDSEDGSGTLSSLDNSDSDSEDNKGKEYKSRPLVRAKSVYEELRDARISENQARLASLGILKTFSELRPQASLPKPEKKRCCKIDYSSTPLRRSTRATGKPPSSQGGLSYLEYSDSEDGRLVRAKRSLRHEISADALARRCGSKGRGSVYDPVYGICCHFCRQKKLCGEEDCERCGNQDIDKPCIGKTECSICHSTNGILCRACLKVRYGEEMEEVKANKDWICPHCTEEKGINPYWICNSSFCLKKRKMVPTGIAIFRAREMGFKSVAHLLMDELQRADKRQKI